MQQPEGFEIEGQEDKIYKLNKSLYGLKQSPRQWYLTFHNAITKLGYEANSLDHCVYAKNSESKFTVLSLYVDDILIVGNDIDMINMTKSWLSSRFEMKDMGEASYILEIKIQRNRKSRLLCLSQEKYLDHILKKFRMKSTKAKGTPIVKGLKAK